LRLKGSLLFLLLACLGAAMAMAAKENEESLGEVVGAATKDFHEQGLSAVAEQTAGVRFDLASIKRPIPKNFRTTGLFESKSWYVPPAPAYIPPPQPTAPPLQLIFIGRMVDAGEVTLFLSKNDRHYVVKEKDILDDTYRIDKIGDSDAVLTYLPTDTQQTLSFNTTPAANALIRASELKTAMLPAIPTPQLSSN